MEFKIGDEVVMCNEEKCLRYPEFYPPAGTPGIIRNVNGEITALVSWPCDSGVDYNDLYEDWCWAVELAYLAPKEEYETKEDEKFTIKKLTEKVINLQQANNQLRKDNVVLESKVNKMNDDILHLKKLAKKIVDA